MEDNRLRVLHIKNNLTMDGAVKIELDFQHFSWWSQSI